MAQHFVTVCVVCVLCAAHTPCYAHATLSPVSNFGDLYVNERLDSSENLLLSQINHTKSTKWKDDNTIGSRGIESYEQSFSEVPQSVDQSVGKSMYASSTSESLAQSYVSRLRNSLEEKSPRDSDHNDEGWQENSKETHEDHNVRIKRSPQVSQKFFVREIFKHFGDGDKMTMEGFEKMMKNMGLFQSDFRVSEQEIRSIDNNQSGSSLASVKESSSNKGSSSTTDASLKQKCMSSRELLSSLSDDTTYTSSTNKSDTTLPDWLFERICPALIYQLAVAPVSDRGECFHISKNTLKPFEIGIHETEEPTRNMFQVWMYSTVSILIISLCGLLGVAVIPVMGKSYYQQLIQFLVALAVGTLCGDALIHLLPHAMASDSEHSHSHEHSFSHSSMEHDDHDTNVWKGFVAVLGLVLFFFTEKALNMIAEWRKCNQDRNKIPARVRVMRESDAGSSNTVGEKLCKHKYSTYPYCYGEISTETQENLHIHQHNHNEKPQIIDEEKPLTCNTTNCNTISNKIIPDDLKKKVNDDWKLDDAVITDKKLMDGSDVPLNDTETYTVIIREHEVNHHGHGHTHSHVHSTPDSMSSIAWMVIMGDGLHNFTDGMAIGAAFSANIAGGFSTTIAVFCHELPHELGDFAVLLKAGMSAKQAVFYNLLSSILCLFGMVFGVLLGTTPAASSWMFAAAAGMFIYIALVDMVPEMSSNHSIAHGAHWQCLLQASGLICGFGIMLIIALYEHDLQHIFND
ncbi:hypothetical protein QAD02_015647 [Eretmocerus hayati]|uniref:Uncharacterized protein n=1 Tax=Eretmocerus hayati TaxID=131215 RepID=A0ACC2PDM6_9HYME|nr:hypothetical protein QAD02_015647 [Eretmocerus hayati]